MISFTEYLRLHSLVYKREVVFYSSTTGNHLLSTYYVLATVLNALCILSHLILTTGIWALNRYDFHFHRYWNWSYSQHLVEGDTDLRVFSTFPSFEMLPVAPSAPSLSGLHPSLSSVWGSGNTPPCEVTETGDWITTASTDHAPVSGSKIYSPDEQLSP